MPMTKGYPWTIPMVRSSEDAKGEHVCVCMYIYTHVLIFIIKQIFSESYCAVSHKYPRKIPEVITAPKEPGDILKRVIHHWLS